ncbi:MAG TPA: serine/threonine-protein kinase, partial [Polyangiaceae bacterium]|nr:serine/threonine-protein kinase [Polyangiaceae bacterium]
MEQTLLAEKYRLLEELGRGGMGSVWRAEHLALSAPIAVKLMAPAIAEAPEALARFHREAQAAAALRSPHVVQILDHGVDAKTGTPFIVMELLEGESLASRLARLGQLEPAATSRIITQVARALTKAHAAGIVHRDLKPDNIFLVNNDDEEIAKVLDFGIAKSETHALAAVTVTGALMGTAYYMSPEQISGSKELDFRTDLWALGVIAHECLLGRRPFEAETIGAMVLRICTQPIERPSSFGSVPEGFDQWFEQAVAREPERRFQSARELADTFKAVCRASLLLTESVDFTTGKTLLSDTGSDRLPKA